MALNSLSCVPSCGMSALSQCDLLFLEAPLCVNNCSLMFSSKPLHEYLWPGPGQGGHVTLPVLLGHPKTSKICPQGGASGCSG